MIRSTLSRPTVPSNGSPVPVSRRQPGLADHSDAQGAKFAGKMQPIGELAASDKKIAKHEIPPRYAGDDWL